jgi:hypothetical protein
MEEVTGHLHIIEQRKKKSESTIDKQGRLLLTEEEWLACIKIRKNSDKGGGSNSGKGRKKATKSHGKEEEKKVPSDDEPIRCTNCGKKGHWAKDYWSKPRKKEKAHVAEIEEEESSLFLLSTTTIQNISPSTAPILAATGGDSALTPTTTLSSTLKDGEQSCSSKMAASTTGCQGSTTSHASMQTLLASGNWMKVGA